MAIDIRATVTCSLGTLISGSISDDYIQGSGLVKTKGSVEISGTITPAIGTVVTFSYTKGGVTRSIPRKLRVMSSFADPFRRTTKVELGCKLTYLSDLQEPVDWTAFDDPENATYTEDDARIVTLPIRASSAMDKCLTELGITASSNPLTNKFSVTNFDFGGGYVQVLNDLLVSESYCGYLDTSEVLQVFALDQDAGTGPVFTSADIVDLGPIGVGALPGEAVTVSYSTLKLKQPDPADNDPNSEAAQTRLWERNKTIATDLTYYVGDQRFTGSEITETITTYSRIAGSDLPVKRITTESANAAKIAGSIGTAYVNNGLGFNNAFVNTRVEEEYITYDSEGNKVTSDTYVYEQALTVFGSLSLTYVFSDIDFVSFNFVLVPSGRVEQTYSTIGTAQQEVTSTYVLWPFTLSGQQAVAEYSEQLQTASAVTDFVNGVSSSGLVHERTTTSINTVGTINGRPSDLNNATYAKGGDPNNGWRTDSQASLELAVGSATAQRRIELSMPYAPDDTFSGPTGGPFTATASDAPAKANRYGRVQNRLLLGNRSGINLQLAPEKLPAAPYSPLYVQANGLTALYRANGTNWAFDSNGIVCSVDALFWAAVGGTGTFWFPVAPGITTLPTTPAIVDGTMTPTTTVLPYNETAVYDGVLHTRLDVTKFEYSLTLLTVIPTFILQIDTQAFNIRLLDADSNSFTTTGQAAALVRRYRLISAATSFVTTGFSAGSVRTFAIGSNVGTFTLTGQDSALVYQRNPMPADLGTFTLSGQDATFTKGQIMAAEVGTFTLTGQDTDLRKTAIITADLGTFSLTGQTADLVYAQSQTAILYYQGNGSTQSITGAGFEPGFVALKRRGFNGTHGWFDIVRGATKYIAPGQVLQETTDADSLTSFDADGFTLGTSGIFNQNSGAVTGTWLAWCLAKGSTPANNTNGTVTTNVSSNTSAEYSIFTYTGVGNTSKTLGHGLTGAPDLVLIKRRGSTNSSLVGGTIIGNELYYDLNQTTATATSSVFVYQSFSSTLISVGSTLSQDGQDYMGWAFKAKSGSSNIADFTGDGTTTYSVSLGYTPKVLILKNTSTTAGDWLLCYRPSGGTGYVNTVSFNKTDEESTSTTVQFTGTGFSVDVGGPGNISGGATRALYFAMK